MNEVCKHCRGRGYHRDYDGDDVQCVYCADSISQQKYDELLSQVEDCNPGYDMSCGRCKACRRRDRGMRGHPECLTCAGSGLRDDTLGNSKTCWCTWDEKLIAELDQIAEINKRRLTDQNQMTDWDL